MNKTEQKSSKFLRLAQNRTNDILSKMDQIGKLSGPAYDWTPDQIKKMDEAVRKRWELIISKFSRKAENKVQEFKF